MPPLSMLPHFGQFSIHYGLTITGHTDPCLPYAYPIQAIRQACLLELERCAIIFSDLGAKIMNIHPCYFCPPAMKKDLLAFNIEALQPIVAMAKNYGLTVVFENFKAPFDRVSTFKTLLAAVPGLKLHLDFGHANFGHDNHERFLQRIRRTYPACSFFRQPGENRRSYAFRRRKC